MRAFWSFLSFVGYWTLIFGFASWFEHALWPWGLPMIPLVALQIWLRREFVRKHPEAKGHI